MFRKTLLLKSCLINNLLLHVLHIFEIYAVLVGIYDKRFLDALTLTFLDCKCGLLIVSVGYSMVPAIELHCIQKTSHLQKDTVNYLDTENRIY